jgi:hypothetical protein
MYTDQLSMAIGSLAFSFAAAEVWYIHIDMDVTIYIHLWVILRLASDVKRLLELTRLYYLFLFSFCATSICSSLSLRCDVVLKLRLSNYV